MRDYFFSIILRFFNLKKSPLSLKERGSIIILIDGLGFNELSSAIQKGYCPFFNRLQKIGYHLNPYYCEPPASTAATEAELFYGNHRNIPGFTWYDRKLQRFVRGNRGADIGVFEKAYAKSAELLKGGSCVFGVFTGGATQLGVSGKDLDRDNPFTIIRKLHILIFVLLNPMRFIYTVYLIGKSLVASIIILVRKKSKRKFRRVLKNSLARIFLGNISTYIAELELIRNTPILFIDYLLYDEFAHEYGIGRKTTLSSLRLVSWYCQSLFSLSRKTGRSYDFIILSDHGQTKSRPYDSAPFGKLERLFEKATGNNGYKAIVTLEKPNGQSHQKKILLVPGGSMVQVYFADSLTIPAYRSQLLLRFPGLESKLLGDKHIGWLLYRQDSTSQILIGREGSVVFRNGRINSISGEPFRGQDLDGRIPASLARYAGFDNNGDIVVFGNWFDDGRITSFEEHKSTHGGFIGEMTQPFILTNNRSVVKQIRADDHMDAVFKAIRSTRSVQ